MRKMLLAAILAAATIGTAWIFVTDTRAGGPIISPGFGSYSAPATQGLFGQVLQSNGDYSTNWITVTSTATAGDFVVNGNLGVGNAVDPSYRLKITGGAYFAGGGADLTIGRSLFIGNDNTGTIETYNITSKDTQAPLTINGGVARGIVPAAQSAAPGTTVEGEFWYNTTLHKLQYYNGTIVETVTSTP